MAPRKSSRDNHDVARANPARRETPIKFSPQGDRLLESLRAAEGRRAAEEQFFEKRNRAAIAVETCYFPNFGGITQEERDTVRNFFAEISWYSNDEEFCRRWVDAWTKAVPYLLEAGFSPDRVAQVYDPRVRDPHIKGQRKDLVILIHDHFLEVMRSAESSRIINAIVAELSAIRRELKGDRPNIEEYFHILAGQVGQSRYTPPPVVNPQQLAEASLHWVRHRDLAKLLLVEGTPWYLTARERPKRAFRAKVRSRNGKGTASLFLVSELLEDFDRLAKTQLSNRDVELPEWFTQVLVSPQEVPLAPNDPSEKRTRKPNHAERKVRQKRATSSPK